MKPRPITNKQLAVLDLLRELGQKRTPCAVCGGAEEGDAARRSSRTTPRYSSGRLTVASDAGRAVPVEANPDDPLEALYLAPSAGRAGKGSL